MKGRLDILAGCLLLLLLLLLPGIGDRSSHSHSVSRSVRFHPDSTFITLDRTSPRMNVRGKLRPQESHLVLDSIINADTLHVALAQDSTIEIRLRPAPRIDRSWIRYLRRDSVIVERVCEFAERPWYESPLLVIIGAAFGLLIAMLI